MTREGLASQLLSLRANFLPIVEGIRRLESDSMPIHDALSIVDTISDSLKKSPAREALPVSNKLDAVLRKNS